MARLALLAILFLSSCSTKHKIDGDIKVQPIDVNHRVSVDMVTLRDFYKSVCITELINPTTQELDNCTTKKIDDFLNALSNSTI